MRLYDIREGDLSTRAQRGSDDVLLSVRLRGGRRKGTILLSRMHTLFAIECSLVCGESERSFSSSAIGPCTYLA